MVKKGKKSKGSGWFGESRRHSMARRGVTTSPYVKFGKMLAKGMDSLAETEEYRGYIIEIHQDFDPMNPRTEWDNLGIMVTSHGKYIIGEETFDSSDFSSWDDVEEHLIKDEGAIVILPLYLLDHSGLRLSTKAFGGVYGYWDSGQVGFIYVNKEQCKKMGTNCKDKDKLKTYLEGEVETMDDYLSGSVYGYNIKDQFGEELDDGSCWGFYGYPNESGLMDDAKARIDWHIKYLKEEEERKSSERIMKDVLPKKAMDKVHRRK